jgi:outer membrane receptor protein involved in Fe transport
MYRTAKARHLLYATVLALGVNVSTVHAAEPANRTYQIAPQSVSTALKAFAAQSSMQVLFTEADVSAARTEGVNGNLAPREALLRMLEGTGLEFEFTAGQVVVVRRAVSQQRTSMLTTDARVEATGGADPESSAPDDGLRLEEIIVSATKRQSTLQQTGVTLSVLGNEELDRRSLVSATDYLSSVPGVYIGSLGLGDNQLVIRGLGLTVGQSPTAGAYLGDIPLSDALDSSITDVKLVDMARIEVLRGPQGTLYGAGAMGGAVRQIPQAPNLHDVQSKVKLGYAWTDESDDPSYNATGVLNLPVVAGVFGLRAAAYHFKKAGYVDLVSSPAMQSLSALMQVPVAIEKDTAGHEYSGARVAALWQPTDSLQVTLTGGHQALEELGRSEVAMSADDYVFSALRTGPEYRKQDLNFANLLIDYDLGWATLTSSSSWTRTDGKQRFSHTRVLPSASVVPVESTKKAFFQELRIATDLDGPVQFVGGGYYEDIERNEDQAVLWASPNLAALPAMWGTTDPRIYSQHTEAELQQLAFFGELSYQLFEPLTLTAGARWFDYERHDATTSFMGVAAGVDPVRSETGDLPAEENGQVYKFAANYQWTGQALLYATWSQGFRLGQTIDMSAGNQLFGSICDHDDDGTIDGTTLPWNAHSTLRSDRLNNIEIGGKFTLFEGRVNLNTAAYRIKWYDLPVTVTVPVQGLGCSATFNGGEARSQGVEFEAVLRATRSLDVTLSGSLTDTEFMDDVGGKKGERLPFAPKYNARLGLQYNFGLGQHDAFIRSDISYVGAAATSLSAPDVTFTDAYRNLGMRAGIALARFNVELYGTNLTGENALVGVFNLNRGWRMEPRVIGVEVSADF